MNFIYGNLLFGPFSCLWCLICLHLCVDWFTLELSPLRESAGYCLMCWTVSEWGWSSGSLPHYVLTSKQKGHNAESVTSPDLLTCKQILQSKRCTTWLLQNPIKNPSFTQSLASVRLCPSLKHDPVSFWTLLLSSHAAEEKGNAPSLAVYCFPFFLTLFSREKSLEELVISSLRSEQCAVTEWGPSALEKREKHKTFQSRSLPMVMIC